MKNILKSNIKMNYPPKEWGPDMWGLLHLLTLYPKGSILEYQQFFVSIALLLPCKRCQHNYINHLKAVPIPSNKQLLVEWLITIHNRVNKSTNTPEKNTQDMITFWKHKYKTQDTIKELKLIETAEYLIRSHPGFYKATEEYIQAHLLFWNFILNHLELKDADEFRKELPSLDTIRHKQLYLDWLLKIKKQYNITSPFRGKTCTSYCMSLLS